MDRWERFRVAIRSARKERDWRQGDVAERAGLSRPVIANIERGHTKAPRMETARKIAKAFGWTDDDLAALLRSGEEPGPISEDALMMARREVPGAPPEELQRYVRMVGKASVLAYEIAAMLEKYGKKPEH